MRGLVPEGSLVDGKLPDFMSLVPPGTSTAATTVEYETRYVTIWVGVTPANTSLTLSLVLADG